MCIRDSIIIREFDAPKFFDAMTKSLSFKDIVSALVILATEAQENKLRTMINVGSPGFKNVFNITIKSILGSAKKISVKLIKKVSTRPPTYPENTPINVPMTTVIIIDINPTKRETRPPYNVLVK